MVYFCYVKDHVLMVSPQIIWDEKMIEYKISQNSMAIVGDKHPLTEKEAMLPINELVKRYPLSR